MSTTSTDGIRQTPGALRERPLTTGEDDLDLAPTPAKKAKTEESNEEGEGNDSEEEETPSAKMSRAQIAWALLNLKPEDLMGVSEAEAAAFLPSLLPQSEPSQYDKPGDDDLFAKMTIGYPEDLTPEQGAIWMAIENGKSVFFTGAAGAGKSHLLRKVIAHKKQKRPGRVFVTAPTGVAACNVGGTTINQFSGIGLGDKSGPAHVAIIRKNREVLARWNRAEVLIIDEISMVSAELFDKLDFIAQRVRDGGMYLPFGGLQVIVCGDFFQLPPVIKEEPKFVPASQANYDSDDDREFDGAPRAPSLPVYCFESAAWATLLPMENQFTLTKIYRQADEDFVDLLNNFRIGSSEGYMGLLPCIGRKWQDRSIVPTQLYPHRRTVEEYNSTQLSKLSGKAVTYKAEDVGTGTAQETAKILTANCSAQETLVLKVGAEVILLRNLDFESGLCNGARGRVIGFVENKKIELSDGEEKKAIATKKTTTSQLPPLPVVKFDNGVESTIIHGEWDVVMGDKVIATRVQIPLALAWAITIHKSQGMTISYLEVDLQGVFAAGQAYVALSRATSLEGLRIKQMFAKSVIRADAKVIAFYRQLANKGRAADDPASENELDSDDDY